jgi:NAD(P)H-dependent FMN reductase
MKVLAISGSLKSDSSNTAVLHAMSKLAAEMKMEFIFFEGLDALPHFSPERDGDHHAAVNHLRAEVKKADGVVICTPEYAFGIPGVLKNALDWLVSSGEMNEKPVAAISASPLPTGGNKAHASLMNTLTALGTSVAEGAKLMIPAIKKKIDANGAILDTEFEKDLRNVLLAFQETITKHAAIIQ